ncbi:copper chaperone CopZ [Niallia sp. FSL R7-0271]|uniref:copper chaperone CopZ n=1 Tax=Niallia sp. FSL R7-0271 TaxID=2921678 RepID=UPI0030F63398
MEKVKLNVQGMSCNHCVNSIEGSVGKIDGVSNVKVDLGAGSVLVEFDKEVVTLDKIKETIDDQGYEVQ